MTNDQKNNKEPTLLNTDHVCKVSPEKVGATVMLAVPFNATAQGPTVPFPIAVTETYAEVSALLQAAGVQIHRK